MNMSWVLRRWENRVRIQCRIQELQWSIALKRIRSRAGMVLFLVSKTLHHTVVPSVTRVG